MQYPYKCFRCNIIKPIFVIYRMPYKACNTYGFVIKLENPNNTYIQFLAPASNVRRKNWGAVCTYSIIIQVFVFRGS